MVYTFRPKGVCSMEMSVNVENQIIKSVEIKGGCPGNSLGVATLVEGMHIEEAIKRLKGITVDEKQDELTNAIEVLEQARTIKPNDSSLKLELARLYQNNAEFIEHLKDAIELRKQEFYKNRLEKITTLYHTQIKC